MKKSRNHRKEKAYEDHGVLILISIFVSVLFVSVFIQYIKEKDRYVTQKAVVLDKYYFSGRDTVYKIVYSYSINGKDYTSSDGVLKNQKDAWEEITIGDSVVVFVNTFFPKMSIWNDTIKKQ